MGILALREVAEFESHERDGATVGGNREEKKTLKDQRGKRGAVSRDIDVATPLPLPSAVGFSKLPLERARRLLFRSRRRKRKKNWRENRVQKIYFPLSLSLSLIENSPDFVTCKSENCFQHLLSYSF